MRTPEEDAWITQKAAEEDGALVLAGSIRMPAVETTSAQFLKVSHVKLLTLAGLAEARDEMDVVKKQS
jgi:hypothetical protein